MDCRGGGGGLDYAIFRVAEPEPPFLLLLLAEKAG
eukprot:COSAG05_NODE_47_length_24712_cov_26.673844_22_plen_35_part_00